MAPLFTGLSLGFGRSADAGGPQGLQATGGTITPAAGKTVHTFLASGTFTVTSGSGNVEYLVVAGGGGGGPASENQTTGAGGGGAGGFRTNVPGHPLAGSALPVSPGPYAVTVGGGGAGKAWTPGVNSFGARGIDSTFSTITSTGGGGGVVADVPQPLWPTGPGGSGGGGGGSSTAGVFGSGNTPSTSPPQGNNGGVGLGPQPWGGGGGGGAGGAGATGPNGAAGGTGSAILTAGSPAPVTYSTGGQGWTSPGNNPITSVNAADNTGNGGPGSRDGTNGGGNGGSGIVIIAYPS